MDAHPVDRPPGEPAPPDIEPAPPDIEPAPPAGDRAAPAGDSRAPASDGDRAAIWMAVVVTIVSILIAIAAWRSTEADSIASDLDSSAIQQLARQQEERGHLEGIVAQDLWLFPRFQEHALGAARLAAEADRLRGADPGLAARLDLEAQGRTVLARTLLPFFQAGSPTIDPDGTSVYDRDYVLRNLEAGSISLQDLRPDEALAAAGQAHAKAGVLVGLAILFAACLLLLSIAQVSHVALRGWLAAAGTLGAAAGAVLLVLVETVLFGSPSA